MNISATKFNKCTGEIIDHALREPVIIEKQGRPTVAVLDYEYFVKLEDSYLDKIASEIESNAQWLSAKESEEFLRS